MILNSKKFVFFGTSRFAVIVLETLEKLSIVPDLIVTNPDAPAGRSQKLSPPPVKIWALAKKVPVFQPEKLSEKSAISKLSEYADGIFLVASYGKMIPESVLKIPKYKTQNIHPSLLPRLRGPAPLQQTILNEEETGVTLMLVDKEMDHGPIITLKKVPITPWPINFLTLEEILAKEGAFLFEKNLSAWIEGKITPEDQAHSQATFTKMIEKKDGEISLEDDAFLNYKKYLAFSEWPGVFFFTHRNSKKIRVKIVQAAFSEGKFSIIKVVPEGKKEMSWDDFLRGNK